MANLANSISANSENPIVFDAVAWLSQFESFGGGFVATDSQTSLCIACHGTAPENQHAAHAMLRELTDEQRGAIIAHIRERVRFSDAQPDLNAILLEKLSEPAGTEPPSSGGTLDDQSQGATDMDMTHVFQASELPRHFAASAYQSVLFAELDALDALAKRASGDNASDAEADRWEQWSIALWAKIEALPVTAENARLKARAIWSIIGGEIDDVASDETTCERLVRQVILGLGTPAVVPLCTDAAVDSTSPRTEWDAATAPAALAQADPIAAYNVAHDAFNADLISKDAYYDAFHSINDFEPRSERDFVRKFVSLWKEGGNPNRDVVESLVAAGMRLVGSD